MSIKIIGFLENRDINIRVKTFPHIYNQTIHLLNLLQAWEEFRKGKRKKVDVGIFEKNLENNLFALHNELKEMTYKHGPYSNFFISDPKVRHIHKARVRDRVVHHLLFTALSPIFEPTFIADSFSCRIGFGTHKGFQKLVFYARKVSVNYTKDCWALKCDVEKFFDSVDHKILLDLIGKRIKDDDMLWLVREIVKSYGISFGKGLPIGNLTSQLFANIYLNELDQYVKETLRIKYYVRYTDDFVLLASDKKYLQQCVLDINKFLIHNLLLKLHSHKTVFRKFSWGIGFLGYTALPHYQIVKTRTKKRIFRKVGQKILLYLQGTVNKEGLKQTFASYFGILSHACSYKLKRVLIYFSMQLLQKHCGDNRSSRIVVLPEYEQLSRSQHSFSTRTLGIAGATAASVCHGKLWQLCRLRKLLGWLHPHPLQNGF